MKKGSSGKEKLNIVAKRPQVTVIGAMKASRAAGIIASSGNKVAAAKIQSLIKKTGKDSRLSKLEGFDTPPYAYTDHAFGYIPKTGTGSPAMVDITDAGNIAADTSLKGASIRITLDRLRVFDYPGSGIHTVLVDFSAQHQTSSAGQSQDLRFTQNYRVQEGSAAGITGFTIFSGLGIAKEGVSFKCSTVNVSNEDDQKIVKFLEGAVFKKGLELINNLNPVIPIVSGFATGIIDTFVHRHDNAAVQDFFMGLDFSGISTRAQLREGSYIAVQVPDAAAWDWTKWGFRPSNGQIVSKQSSGQSVPFNYIVFSISKMQA
jgi:hypothetical protein